MFVSLKDVINLPEFADVEILAGKNGLYRNVTSISINDLRKEFVTLDCISTGDLYITSLHQYAKDCNDAELWAFVKTFIETTGLPGALLPALVFILAAFLSFATGTSWGTFRKVSAPLLRRRKKICRYYESSQ